MTKLYRCKHAVEAMRWTDTDENREAFAAWFESHDVIFETRGPVVVIPEDCGEAVEGEWILYSHDEFIVMEHDAFVAEYDEVPHSYLDEIMASLAKKPRVEPDLEAPLSQSSIDALMEQE